jgi:hypothetical protein
MDEYKVLKAHDEGELGNKVNEHLADGWQLYGNLVVSVSDRAVVYAQAMLKTKKEQGMGALGLGSARRRE